MSQDRTPMTSDPQREDELIDRITKKDMTIKELFFRLFMTRDDNLDLLQFMFLIMIIFFMVSFSLVGMGKWTVTNAAWTMFGSVFATLAIMGAPTWIAHLLANKKKDHSHDHSIEMDNTNTSDEIG